MKYLLNLNQSECRNKASPSTDQKSSTPVCQSNQKKTHAMVAKSHEDDEEAFTCMINERPRSRRGSSKRSSLNILASNDEVLYSAACRAQSNDGQIYIGVGKLNAQPVKVLQDAGCTGMIVDLISDGDTRQFRLAADGRPHSD